MGLIKRFMRKRHTREAERDELATSCTMAAQETKETLNRLSTLTEALDFGNVGVPPARAPEMREIESKNGYIFQVGVHKSRGIGVCKLFMTKDADCHFCCTAEWSMLIVWRGRIRVASNEGRELELKEKQYVEAKQNTKLHLTATENAWILGVAIPPPESWPGGPYSYRLRRKKDEK